MQEEQRRINRHFADACGRNPADFIGKSTREIFPKEEAEECIKNDSEVVIIRIFKRRDRREDPLDEIRSSG